MTNTASNRRSSAFLPLLASLAGLIVLGAFLAFVLKVGFWSPEDERKRQAKEAFRLAAENPGDPIAYQALVTIIRDRRNEPDQHSFEGIRRIKESFVGAEHDSDFLFDIALRNSSPDVERLLQLIRKNGATRSDRGLAHFILIEHLDTLADRITAWSREKKSRERAAEIYGPAVVQGHIDRGPEAVDLEANRLRELFLRDFDDFSYKGERLAPIVAGILFRNENLNIGQVAPDIAGRDVDGNGYQLSDYRGKVVVLSFGATWCGPCKKYYEPQRELVKKYREAPFALIGINADDDPDAIRKRFESGLYTWPVWFEGEKYGSPICSSWGIQTLPTLLVLDHEHVIRHVTPSPDELGDLVAELIRRAPPIPEPPEKIG